MVDFFGLIEMAKQTTLFGEVCEPMPKRRRPSESEISEDSRKSKETFKDSWKSKAPWPKLQGVDLPETVRSELPGTWLAYKCDDGMYCMLCTKWNKIPRRGIPTWTNEPCILLRLESVNRHRESQMHIMAIKQELDYQLSSVDGGIATAFENLWEAEESAIKAALACVYFLAKEEIPHTTKYESIMKFLSYLGLSHFDFLYKGGNAKYTSYRVVDELLTLLGDEVKRNTTRCLQQSPCIGHICDETTDLSTTKALVIYAKAIVHCNVQTHLMCLKELPCGEADAAAVLSCIQEAISDCGLQT